MKRRREDGTNGNNGTNGNSLEFLRLFGRFHLPVYSFNTKGQRDKGSKGYKDWIYFLFDPLSL